MSSHRIVPLSVRRLAPVLALGLTFASAAFAQMPGKGLLDYVSPIIVTLGLGAIICAMAASVFRPEWVKTAAYAAIILVVLFFIIRTAPQLAQAVQA